MEKSMADQFLEQQQAAQEQQQAEAEKAEAEKAKDREFELQPATPPQPEQEQPSRPVDLDEIRTETAKLDERQAAAMQNHLQDQMPDKSGAEIENIRSIGDAEAGKLSASQQREQEQEELER